MLVIGDSWWLSGCNGFEYRPTVRVVSGSINRGVDAMIEAEGFEQSIVKEIFHFFRKCNFERAPESNKACRVVSVCSSFSQNVIIHSVRVRGGYHFFKDRL
jgi:hypothetical protein